ncbi:MAG: XdhC family protein [Phycisphaerae bacterium]
MNELEQILHAADEARGRGVDAVIATVVRVAGSTYRRPGARLLLALDGQRCGAISGGCLEKEVARKARWLTAAGAPVVARYDTSADNEIAYEFGLGCQGVVWALLERLPADHEPPDLAFIRGCFERRLFGVIATVIGADDATEIGAGHRLYFDAAGAAAASDGVDEPRAVNAELGAALADDVRAALRERRSRGGVVRLPRGSVDVFLELVQPPLQLIVCGAGYDAAPVVRMAAELGWRVVVADGRSAYAQAARFPGAVRVCAVRPEELCASADVDERTVAVVMSHNYYDDLGFVRALLASKASYIGLLGPRKRTGELLSELHAADAAADAVIGERVFAPVGLDIGAETPAEIAAGIVAEILAVLARRDGGSLRDRDLPIHDAIVDAHDDGRCARGSAASRTSREPASCRLPSGS